MDIITELQAQDVKKTISDKFPIAVDLSEMLHTSSKISDLESNIKMKDKLGNDVGATMLSNRTLYGKNKKLKITISGGQYHLSPYTVRFDIFTTNRDRYIVNFKVEIVKK